MKSPKFRFLLALIVAVVQISILFFMIASHKTILNNGREIVLTIRPVDPRDFMRGDYVVLAYPALADLRLKNEAKTQDIYVLLRSDQKDNWVYIASKATPFSELSANEVQLHGQRNGFSYQFGIERFYVPEGQGKEIEQKINQQKGADYDAVIMVSSSGDAVIKTLRYKGQSLFDVP